jgi:hypothetical protein
MFHFGEFKVLTANASRPELSLELRSQRLAWFVREDQKERIG